MRYELPKKFYNLDVSNLGYRFEDYIVTSIWPYRWIYIDFPLYHRYYGRLTLDSVKCIALY